MKTRREFLRNTGLIALTPLVPSFLEELAHAAPAQADPRILVIVELEGGNDGINTVVPFADPAYARSRPNLRLKPEEVLKIDQQVGFNPSMRPMADLLGAGRLAIVQGVGYPNPNRSHFESMRIWQTARLNPARDELGWIGSALDALPQHQARAGPDALYVGDAERPEALSASHAETAAITSIEDLQVRLPGPQADSLDATEQDTAGYVHRSVLRAYGTARDLSRDHTVKRAGNPPYPATKLGTQLEVVSQIIKSGAATRVYFVSQGSYDTHVAQLPRHESLLAELSSAIKAFMDDLRGSGLSERVLLMTFSEFGRRVAENGSLGTDHGAAAPVFLAGESVKPGLFGKTPGLSDLSDGDLRASIDFRRVYATLLRDWLKITPGEAIAAFEPMPLIK
ncbi:MAG TPA: DUF1501 domain-containing protein [Tepidisphaeraceae bacterium]|jgi:uncharacterized protein (DUF1501 family)|nr:DUF1501 domain-containing protein [Tepidisphaeraceae bacterium]